MENNKARPPPLLYTNILYLYKYISPSTPHNQLRDGSVLNRTVMAHTWSMGWTMWLLLPCYYSFFFMLLSCHLCLSLLTHVTKSKKTGGERKKTFWHCKCAGIGDPKALWWMLEDCTFSMWIETYVKEPSSIWWSCIGGERRGAIMAFYIFLFFSSLYCRVKISYVLV